MPRDLSLGWLTASFLAVTRPHFQTERFRPQNNNVSATNFIPKMAFSLFEWF
jgi:hypothetical protein